MRRSTPVRMGFLGVIASLVFVFGMLISTGTASAHTASTQKASWGCGEFDCGGGFGFNQCGDFGVNDDGFNCGFGFNNFNNCSSDEIDCGFGFNNFGFNEFNNCDSF